MLARNPDQPTEAGDGTLTIDSSLGPIRLVATAAGLTHVRLSTQTGHNVLGDRSLAARKILDDAANQLLEYVAGKRTCFDLVLAPAGTPFQTAVWQALLQIPFGTTTSYGAIARQIGKPKAVRAVGAANGKNPIAIVIPCHRVIGKTGALTGYAGGVAIKQRLLQLEASAV